MGLKRGLFVTLEGPDGSGKSTQRALLSKSLRAFGYQVVETREPGGSPLAEQIRALVLNTANKGLRIGTELLLFEAARCQHVDDTIRPALAAGKVVLCDRFTDSTIAYQGAGRAIDKAQVLWLNRFACSGLKPNLTLVYDLGVKEGLSRAKKAKGRSDRMEEVEVSFHARVRSAFKAIAKKEPRRVKIIQVSGRQAHSIHEEGLTHVLRRLA